MAAFDFKALIDGIDPALKTEVTDAMWADLGRRVHQNLMDEKFVKALVNAHLSAVNNAKREPVHQGIARRVRAYILSGAITS